MKKKVIILIIFFLLITMVLKVSYSYNNEDLNENDILIGNDVYSGYISPNDIVNSALNYYIETNDRDGLKTFKVKDKELNKINWEYLVDDFKYEKLDTNEINKLEIRRLTNNIKNKLNSLDEEELKKYSVLEDENTYYFFMTDLNKLNITSIKNTYGYVVYKDHKIKNYNINFNNKYYVDSNDRSDLKIVNVNDYGAKENDDLDDTNGIKKAVEKINELKTGILYFERGKYNVSVGHEFEELKDAFNNPDNPEYEKYKNYPESLKQYYLYWTIQGKSIKNEQTNFIVNLSNFDKRVVIELNNSEIKLLSNSMSSYKIFDIRNSKDIVVRNGKITGDRVEHNYTDHKEDIGRYSEYLVSHTWGHGIAFLDTYGTIENMIINNLTGDGISIYDRGAPNVSTTYLNNIEIYKNRRMGITIEEVDKVIANNIYIHEIGDFDNIAGVLPKSGVDIESEITDKPTNYVEFNNSLIENCTNYGIVSSARTTKNDNGNVIETKPFVKELILNKSMINDKNTFYNGKIYNTTIEMNLAGTTFLNNALIKNSNIYLNANNDWINFINSSIENTVIKGAYSDTMGNYLRYNNSTFRNCTIYDFQGYSKEYGKNNYTRTGIQLNKSTLNTFDNNKFYNNNFVMSSSDGGEFYFNNSYYENNTFNLSTIGNFNINNTILKECSFNNRGINLSKIAYKIDSSELYNTVTGSSKNYINNSYLEVEKINGNRMYNYDSKIINSTIKILGEIKNSQILSNVLFNEKTNIILEKYNSKNPLIINNSTINKDYIVTYNGTEEIFN